MFTASCTAFILNWECKYRSKWIFVFVPLFGTILIQISVIISYFPLCSDEFPENSFSEDSLWRLLKVGWCCKISSSHLSPCLFFFFVNFFSKLFTMWKLSHTQSWYMEDFCGFNHSSGFNYHKQKLTPPIRMALSHYLQSWMKHRRSKLCQTYVRVRLLAHSEREFRDFLNKGRLARLRCLYDCYALTNVAGDKIFIEHKNGFITISSEDEWSLTHGYGYSGRVYAHYGFL